MSDATKRLEGVIDLKLTDRAESVLGRMQKQFQQMEESVDKAMGRGSKSSRGGGGAGGQATQMVQATQKAASGAGKYAVQIEKISQTIKNIRQGLVDQQVVQTNQIKNYDALYRMQRKIVQELEKGEDVDKGRLAKLKAMAQFEEALIGRRATINEGQRRMDEATARRQRQMDLVHARAVQENQARERSYYATRARADADNLRRDKTAQQAERKYYSDRSRAEADHTRRKQAQVQAQMRMNAMHKAALQTNEKMTAEIRKQSGLLGVVGRRLQAQGRLRGGVGGSAMEGAGNLLEVGGRTANVVSSGMSKVWDFTNRMLRVYWIALSMFYALRNVVQLITDSLRVVLGIAGQVAKVFIGITVKVIEASARIEQLRARMMTMFGERAKGVLGWVMDEAIGKPFEWTELAEGVTRAMVMGVKDTRVMREVVRVAEDMAVAFEQPVERAVQAIMQASTGHFRSMIETFGFRPELAVTYGAVPATQGQGIGGGLQNLNTNLQAILRMVTDRVGGAADAMKNTWKGLVSDVSDMWSRLVNDVFEPTLRPLKAVLAGLREMFLDGGQMAPWGADLVTTFKEAWSVVEDLAKHLVPLLPNFAAFMVATYSYFVAKFKAWYEGQGGMVGILASLQEKFFEWGPAIIRGVAYVAELLGSIGVAVAAIASKVAGGAMVAGARKKLEQGGFVPTLYGNGLQAYGTTADERARMAATGDPELQRFAARTSMAPNVGYWTPERYQQTAKSMGIADDPEVAAWLRQMQETTQAFDHQMTSISTMVDRSIAAQDRLKTTIVDPLLRAADAIEAAYTQAQGQGGGSPQFIDILRNFNPEWAQHYERLQKKMGHQLSYEEIVKNLPMNLQNAMQQGATVTEQAIEDGFEAGSQKIENMFDVAKFMGYTAMAARRGYGTQEAMNLSQSRVLEEMAVRSGKAGASVSPWPWAGSMTPVQQTYYGPGRQSAAASRGAWGPTAPYPSMLQAHRQSNRRKQEASDWIWGATTTPAGSIAIDVNVKTAEGIEATVERVVVNRERDRSLGWHRG